MRTTSSSTLRFPSPCGLRRSLLLATAFFFTTCSEPDVPGGSITIRNDILDKEYNSFVVDDILAGGALTGQRIVLRPGEEVTLEQKGISSLRFTRRYSDHSNIYVVDCPKGFHKAVTMKLIDVHSNRLGGGCKLVRKGESRNGSVTWEKE
ncbi:MAG: hypothetical protein U0136_14560 [Bdellovibrionota bacterium]